MFQSKCFDVVLTSSDLTLIKKLILSVDPEGLNQLGDVNESGFLALNKHFLTSVNDRNPHTVWQALRSFGFDNSFKRPLPSFSASDRNLELTSDAEAFLRRLHSRHASSSAIPSLSVTTLNYLLEVVHDIPRHLRHPGSYVHVTTDGLTVEQFLLLFHLSFAFEPVETVRTLCLLGFNDDQVPCHTPRNRRSFRCLVINSNLTNRYQFISTLPSPAHPRAAEFEESAAFVTTPKLESVVLAVKEISDFNCTTSPELHPMQITRWDCVAIGFDSTDSESLRIAFEIQRAVSKIPDVATVFIGTNSFLNPETSTPLLLECSKYCEQHHLISPIRLPSPSSTPDAFDEVWSTVVQVCHSPATSCSNLRSRQLQRLVPLTVGVIVLSGAIVWWFGRSSSSKPKAAQPPVVPVAQQSAVTVGPGVDVLLAEVLDAAKSKLGRLFD
eukprot:c9926_g1_i1.p1 GENE.c9926_g1_i1~~c9926_g1_i1.p1  ORF type:complete len:440 (-),score=101.92 c9926_g1_i1:51-1370(-)